MISSPYIDPTMCGNIWKLDGECRGQVRPYTAARRDSQEFYDPETLEPFERYKFSIRNAVEIRSKSDTRQAIITYLCDHHRKLMDEIHPELALGLADKASQIKQ